MNDQFVPNQTEYEFQYNQILQLQQQTKTLQEDFKNLEELVKLNKEALRLAITKPPEDEPGKDGDKKSPENQYQEFLESFDIIFNANQSLLQQIEKLKKERNICQSKAFIHELIAEESQKNENEIIAELEDKINDIKGVLHDKENTLRDLEKSKAIIEDDGVALKLREILSQEEQSIKLKKELKTLRKYISRYSKILHRLKEENEELRSLNVNLGQELAKMKATMATHKISRKFAKVDLNTSSIYAFKTSTGHDGDDEEVHSVELRTKKRQRFLNSLLAPNPNTQTTSLDPREGVKHQQAPKSLSIPKLDLSKAKKIQELTAQKMTQNLAPANNPNDPMQETKLLEQMKKLELEYKDARKMLERQSLANRLMENEANNLRLMNQEIHATNATLIKSNKEYEIKGQRLFYTLEFYREFYSKYIDMLATRQQDLNRSFDGYIDEEPKSTASNHPPSKEFVADVTILKQLQTKIDQLPLKSFVPKRDNGALNDLNVDPQLNVSILDVEDNWTNMNQGYGNEFLGEESRLQKCKMYLRNMAADLDSYLHQCKNKLDLHYNAKRFSNVAESTGKSNFPRQTRFAKEAEDINDKFVNDLFLSVRPK